MKLSEIESGKIRTSYKGLAQQLDIARSEYGISAAKVCVLTGVSSSQVSRALMGDRDLPVKALLALAQCLECSITDLVSGGDNV